MAFAKANQRTKSTVFGWIREMKAQCALRETPAMLQCMIVSYYWIPSDCFENHGKLIKLSSDSHVAEGTKFDETERAVLGKMIIDVGNPHNFGKKFTWILKVNEYSGSAINVGIIESSPSIGVFQRDGDYLFDMHHCASDEEEDEIKWGRTSYSFNTTGKLQVYSQSISDSEYKQVPLRKLDDDEKLIIEIKIQCKKDSNKKWVNHSFNNGNSAKLTFSIKIQESDQQLVLAEEMVLEDIEPKKYRLVATMFDANQQIEIMQSPELT